MPDRYRTFADLAANERRGQDYRIRLRQRGSETVVIAPHGGYIEPQTSEIAERIAGSDLSFYAFEALRVGPHRDFHITSHRFDEPHAVDIVSKANCAIAIHGRRNDGANSVWMGGRDELLMEEIICSLREAGFLAEPNTKLPGMRPSNICNRTRTGKGVQLELPRLLRNQLRDQNSLMADFCEAVRRVICDLGDK